MNQIYNLAQTIAADKETITKLEKHLLNAKSILTAHENAMERLTTIISVIVSDKGIGASRGSVQADKVSPQPTSNYTRITMDNYLSLGIEVGDEVEIVVSGDNDFCHNTRATVTDLNYMTGVSTILELSPTRKGHKDWYCYDFNSLGEYAIDEIYLIRTPEGSLNKQ